jgi:hypothetical protein
MKLLYLIVFCYGLVYCEDEIIKSPKALSFNQLENLDDIFNFENVDENMEHFDQELNLNFLKKIESSSGYIDAKDTFKLIPCKNYFSLFKRINGKYSHQGKILYPNKFSKPSSIFVADNGDSFIAVFSRFDKKIEEYEYKLFVWHREKNNMYSRSYLGYVDSAAMSEDGSSIVGFNIGLKKSYYWKLKNNEFKLTNDSNIVNRSNNPLIGINRDGSRFFILDKSLLREKSGDPTDDYFLELDIFETPDDGSSLRQAYGFLLPAKSAIADLNSQGDIMVLCFISKRLNTMTYTEEYCTGADCFTETKNIPELLIINLKDLKGNPDLLYYAKVNKMPSRLQIQSENNSLLLGFEDHYDLYNFNLPNRQKIVSEVKAKISCEKLLSSLDDKILD